MADVETVVVGAGAVGLAVARSLARAGQETVVLEQHGLVGSEISSRNSEVIHAGIYYPPGSLRARLCVRGKELLYPFLAEHGVQHRRLGKLLVATGEAQLATLASYRQTAERNGVTDLVPLDSAAARALEPEVACSGALLSPSTGIIDSHGYMLALQGEAEAHGAQVVLRSRVGSLEHTASGYAVRLAGEAAPALTARRLVVAGGLHASRLADTLAYPGPYRPPPTYYARGRYFALRGRPPFRRLIYPMPDGAWLGIHVTLDLAGRARFGPDIAWIPEIDYRFEADAEPAFAEAIRRYWPGLPEGALQPDSTGIRPKLYRPGEPVADFAIHGPATHGLPDLALLLGIESPGLTSSLAIGEHVRDLLAGAREEGGR